MTDSIRIPCEGSDCATHAVTMFSRMCAMCGRLVAVGEDGTTALPHERDDILAMIDRGDFG